MIRTRTTLGNLPRALLLAAVFLSALTVAPAFSLDISMDNPPSSTPTISKGDPVSVHGTATGHPSNGLQVWLIGTNYARVGTTAVESDNTFEYRIPAAVTQDLAAGQYFVLVQHPMMNGEFDITYNAGTGEVTNEQLNGGTTIFRLTGAGSLQGSHAASTLMSAVASQNIDDTFTSVSFFVAQPSNLIDPIGKRTVGEKFAITGSTNLAAGNTLLIDVYSTSFKPTKKAQSGEFSGASGTVIVTGGTEGYNRWSFDVDTSAWRTDEYIVAVTAIAQDVSDSTTFVLAEGTLPPATTPVTLSTTTIPVNTLTTLAPVAAATTQKSPGSALPLLAVPLLAAVLRLCRGKL